MGDNYSDQCIFGIKTNTKLQAMLYTKSSSSEPETVAYRYQWDNNNKQIFYNLTGSVLIPLARDMAFVELLNCKEKYCKNCAHISSLLNLAENLISILLHCSEHCKQAIKSTNRISWSNELKICKLESINAHRCWEAHNKLCSDDVYEAKVSLNLNITGQIEQ